MIKVNILTDREREVIRKKLENKRLNQLDSNILTRSVRPKLEAIKSIDANHLMQRLKYNQKSISIENKIRNLILKNLRGVRAIIVYGSYVINNYDNYNDIDVLILVKEPFENLGKKYENIDKLEKIAKKENLDLDIQILSQKYYNHRISRSPNLAYQMKDSKIIYGEAEKISNVEISKLDLYMKLDDSDIVSSSSEGEELYRALRNIIMVRLLSLGIISNSLLKYLCDLSLGVGMVNRLRSNKVSKEEKKLVFKIIRLMGSSLTKELKEAQWEKIKVY